MTYIDIAKKIERLEHQTAIINQILFNKRYIRLTKRFENEGIEIVENIKSKGFSINVELIK